MSKTIISYKPLEITLIKHGKNKQYLRNVLNISPSTIARLSKGEVISLEIIKRICDHFDCDIKDVIEFIPVDV